MKSLKNDTGFTLMETLVSINLIFLVITFILSFYLFSSRFIYSFTKNMEETQTIYNILGRIETIFSRSNSFEIVPMEGYLIFKNELGTNVIFRGQEINFPSYMNLSEIDLVDIRIKLPNGEIIPYSTDGAALNMGSNEVINSNNLKNISIKLQKHNKYYSIDLYTPYESARMVNNLKE